MAPRRGEGNITKGEESTHPYVTERTTISRPCLSLLQHSRNGDCRRVDDGSAASRSAAPLRVAAARGPARRQGPPSQHHMAHEVTTTHEGNVGPMPASMDGEDVAVMGPDRPTDGRRRPRPERTTEATCGGSGPPAPTNSVVSVGLE